MTFVYIVLRTYEVIKEYTNKRITLKDLCLKDSVSLIYIYIKKFI